MAQKLLADTPLLTGQRVLDALFPAVLGGELLAFLHRSFLAQSSVAIALFRKSSLIFLTLTQSAE